MDLKGMKALYADGIWSVCSCFPVIPRFSAAYFSFFSPQWSRRGVLGPDLAARWVRAARAWPSVLGQC